MSEELYTYYNIMISVSVSTKKGGPKHVVDTLLYITNIVVLLTVIPSIINLLY
jgi:hypothetical protein